jgi:hypothetical protein
MFQKYLFYSRSNDEKLIFFASAPTGGRPSISFLGAMTKDFCFSFRRRQVGVPDPAKPQEEEDKKKPCRHFLKSE